MRVSKRRRSTRTLKSHDCSKSIKNFTRERKRDCLRRLSKQKGFRKTSNAMVTDELFNQSQVKSLRKRNPEWCCFIETTELRLIVARIIDGNRHSNHVALRKVKQVKNLPRHDFAAPSSPKARHLEPRGHEHWSGGVPIRCGNKSISRDRIPSGAAVLH